MFHPTRGGTRGGAAEFSWADVKADKDRENYLGHSVNAPAGRWQNGKDIRWFEKDKNETDQDKRREELRRVKEAEQIALNEKLGLSMDKVGPVTVGHALLAGASGRTSHSISATGTNRSSLPAMRRWGGEDGPGRSGSGSPDPSDGLTKEERKAAKKLAKQEVKEKRREERERIREEREKRRAERLEGSGRRADHNRDRRHGSSRQRDRSRSRDEAADSSSRHQHSQRETDRGHDERDGYSRRHRSRDYSRSPRRDDRRDNGRDYERTDRHHRDDASRYRSRDDRREGAEYDAVRRGHSPNDTRRRSPGRSLSPPLRRSRP